MREATLQTPGMFEWPTMDQFAALDSIRAGGAVFRRGDRVRLHPGRARGNGADIFDLALVGKAAVIAAIERDFENRVHVAVTVEDDPGRDLGDAALPAHRFYFAPEELEPLGRREASGR